MRRRTSSTDTPVPSVLGQELPQLGETGVTAQLLLQPRAATNRPKLQDECVDGGIVDIQRPGLFRRCLGVVVAALGQRPLRLLE